MFVFQRPIVLSRTPKGTELHLEIRRPPGMSGKNRPKLAGLPIQGLESLDTAAILCRIIMILQGTKDRKSVV